MRKALFLMLVFGACRSDAVHAQDVHFSQFYENALLRNPALVGVFSGDYRLTGNYRSQWSGAGVPFITYTGSAECRVAIRGDVGDYLSFGLAVVADKAGTIDFRSTSTYAAVNYSKTLNDARTSYLSAGFTGGFIQRSVDPTKMTFASQYATGTASGAGTDQGIQGTSMQHFDVGTGISLNGSFSANGRANYYLGVAGYHLNRPKEAYGAGSDFITLTPRYTGSAGLRVGLGERTALTVHAGYQYQQPHRMLIAGGLIGQQLGGAADRATAFSAGCFYRAGDAVIPTVRLDMHLWSVIFSYDIAQGEKRTYLNGAGGTEVSLILRGRLAHRRPNPLQCPRFEEFLQYW